MKPPQENLNATIPTPRAASVIISFDTQALAPFFGRNRLGTFYELSKSIEENPSIFLFKGGSPHNLLSFSHDINYSSTGAGGKGLKIKMSFIDPTYDFELRFTKSGNMYSLLQDEVGTVAEVSKVYPNAYKEIYEGLRTEALKSLSDKMTQEEKHAILHAVPEKAATETLRLAEQSEGSPPFRNLVVAYGIGEDLTTWAGPFVCSPIKIINKFDGKGSRIIEVEAAPSKSILGDRQLGSHVDDGFDKFGEGYAAITCEDFGVLGSLELGSEHQHATVLKKLGGFHSIMVTLIRDMTSKFIGDIPANNIVVALPNMDKFYHALAQKLLGEIIGFTKESTEQTGFGSTELLRQLSVPVKYKILSRENVKWEYSYAPYPSVENEDAMTLDSSLANMVFGPHGKASALNLIPGLGGLIGGTAGAVANLVGEAGGDSLARDTSDEMADIKAKATCTVTGTHLFGIQLIRKLLDLVGCNLLYLDVSKPTIKEWALGGDVTPQEVIKSSTPVMQVFPTEVQFYEGNLPNATAEVNYRGSFGWGPKQNQDGTVIGPLTGSKIVQTEDGPIYEEFEVPGPEQYGIDTDEIIPPEWQFIPGAIDWWRSVNALFAPNKVWAAYRAGKAIESYEDSLYSLINDIKKVGGLPGTPTMLWVSEQDILNVLAKHKIIQDPTKPAFIIGTQSIIDDIIFARIKLKTAFSSNPAVFGLMIKYHLHPDDFLKFTDEYLEEMNGIMTPPAGRGVFEELFAPDVKLSDKDDSFLQFASSKEEDDKIKEMFTKVGIPVFRSGVKKSNITNLQLDMNPHYFTTLLMSYGYDQTKLGPTNATSPQAPALFGLNGGDVKGVARAFARLKNQAILPFVLDPDKKLEIAKNASANLAQALKNIFVIMNKKGPVIKYDTETGGTPAQLTEDLLARLMSLFMRGGIRTLPLFSLAGWKAINRPVYLLVKENRLKNFSNGFFKENDEVLKRFKPVLSQLYSGFWTIFGFRHVITSTDCYSEFTIIKSPMTPPQANPISQTQAEGPEEVIETDNAMASQSSPGISMAPRPADLWSPPALPRPPTSNGPGTPGWLKPEGDWDTITNPGYTGYVKNLPFNVLTDQIESVAENVLPYFGMSIDNIHLGGN